MRFAFLRFCGGRGCVGLGCGIVEESRVEYLFSLSFNFVESGGHQAYV